MAGWVVRWVSPTGVEGGGDVKGPGAPLEVAVFWCKELSHRPTLQGWEHWIEKVES